MSRRYKVNEVFYSVQGEGARVGQASVFVRLSNCNMRCEQEPGPRSPGGFDCDTEFASGRWATAGEVAAEALRLWPLDAQGSPRPPQWAIFTGGEPALQLDRELLTAVRAAGFRVAVETNGSMVLPHEGDLDHPDVAEMSMDEVLRSCFPLLDWVVVSPKVAEHAVRQKWAHELRYVRGAGQAVPEPSCRAVTQFVSPAHDGLRLDPEALRTCLQIVRENPEWRVSVQQHKAWSVR